MSGSEFDRVSRIVITELLTRNGREFTDNNYWQQIESYVSARSEAQFSHSICPACYERVVKPELESFQQLPMEPLKPVCSEG
ncbi:MAG TPA: hypothetical protein VFS12_12275 [Terriglobia bacterium]|nr:hypothetical protein [Terriglobia bacterium]